MTKFFAVALPFVLLSSSLAHAGPSVDRFSCTIDFLGSGEFDPQHWTFDEDTYRYTRFEDMTDSIEGIELYGYGRTFKLVRKSDREEFQVTVSVEAFFDGERGELNQKTTGTVCFHNASYCNYVLLSNLPKVTMDAKGEPLFDPAGLKPFEAENPYVGKMRVDCRHWLASK